MQLILENLINFEMLGHLLFFMFIIKFVILVRSCKFSNHFVGVTLVNKESLPFSTKTHLCCVLRKTMIRKRINSVRCDPTEDTSV